MQITYELIYGHAWKRAAPASEPAAKSIRVFKRVP
jgi:hypothetical protein